MIPDKIKEEIEKFSSLVRKQFEMKIPIMSVNNLIKELGGKIEYGEGIEKDKDSFIIRIKEDPLSTDGKFKILKALGVLIFENGLIVDPDRWTNTSTILYPDSYAISNEFAASMLMPRDIFIDYFTDDYDLEDTADHFGVNETLVRVRAKWLGLIIF